MQYKIIEEKNVYRDFLTIQKATIEHERFSDGKMQRIERECLWRNDAVAVLIHEKDTDTLLFTRQFRFATTRYGDGWITELPAGVIENNESPVDCARREVKEELGYQIDACSPITTIYTSPGITTERIHLFFAQVMQADKSGAGGGVASEKEDIQLVKYPKTELPQLLQAGVITDAKTLVALQWFLLLRKN